MKCSASLLRWLTLGVLLGTVGIVIVMMRCVTFSAELKGRVDADADGLGSPVLFAELARGRAEFERVFVPAVVRLGTAQTEGESEESEDVKSLKRSLRLDYFFIAAYTSLLLLLGLRCGDVQRELALRRWLLVLLPPVIGMCDVMENLGILNSLEHLREHTLTDGMIARTRGWSMTKWQLSFVDLLLLGWCFVGAERWGCRDCAVLLRRAGALLLAVGAVTGFGGLALPRLVPAGFGIGLLSMVPILLMLVFCPDAAWGRQERE